ncbi:MAG TPA: hypothetical protein VJ719_05155 [Chthoniobacterales bacterium]|nr:hypothetical protein [Chthoniobacterales bacterium]
MNGAEILTTIAQLGAAVTGFSGIAIAFNRHPGRLGEFEAFRVSILFANSLAAVFLALVPFAFFQLGWPDSTIWRVCSGGFALFEVVFLATHFAPARRFIRQHRALFNVGLLTFVTCGHLMNGIAQLLSATGVFDRILAVYVFGLLWILFHSTFQFGRILFVQPDTGGAMSMPRTKPADQADG